MKCRIMCLCVCVCVFDVEGQTPPIFESKLFYQSFHVSAVFKNRTFDLLARHATGELFVRVVCKNR
jgi:hypothetical protein